jgi:hypothetical protein
MRLAGEAAGLPHTLISESLLGAFLSVSRERYGFAPRFTYRIDGAATLWHSFDRSALPVNVSLCDFLNGAGWTEALLAGKRPPPPPSRIVVQLSKPEAYRHLHTWEECRAVLEPFANDSGVDICGHELMRLVSNKGTVS